MPTSQTNTIRLRSRELAELARNPDLVVDLREPPDKGLRTARASGTARPVRFAEPSSPLATSEILLYPGEAVRPYLSTRIAVRVFDLLVATLALILLAPVMLVVAVAVRVDSPGPSFYGSQRLGHRTPTFKAWKFRSMVPDAEAQLQTLLQTDPRAAREYEIYHKLKDDPRLTRVGAFIRRTSLDELPQLFNILLGDMSVVGPRPKLLNEAELFGEAIHVVLQIRPGLTGLWQVSGRNRLPVHDWVIMDIDYARNRTMAGDLAICWRTFLQLWRPGKHGAY